MHTKRPLPPPPRNLQLQAMKDNICLYWKKRVVLVRICDFGNTDDMIPFKSKIIQRLYRFLSVHHLDSVNFMFRYSVRREVRNNMCLN